MDWQTYYWYGNQVHRLYQMDNHCIHCNVIVHQYTVHFHIETYSKDILCQFGPHLIPYRFLYLMNNVCVVFCSFDSECIHLSFENEMHIWFKDWMKVNEQNENCKITHILKIELIQSRWHVSNWKQYKEKCWWKCILLQQLAKNEAKCTYCRNVHQNNHGNQKAHYNRRMNECNHRCYISIHLDDRHLESKWHFFSMFLNTFSSLFHSQFVI